MKKRFALLCLLLAAVQGFALAEQVSTPSDLSPAPTVTAAPTEEPTAMPTAAPTETPTEAPTTAPTANPMETPTEAPTTAPTEVPTETPTATPAPTSGPAYYDLADGSRRYGKLEALMADALAANARVYLTRSTVYALPGWTLAQVQQVKLFPDSDAFPENGWTVYCSATNPSGATAANTVYVWVAQTAADPTETPAPTEAPTETPTAAPTEASAPSEQPQPTEETSPNGGGQRPSGGGGGQRPSGGMPSGSVGADTGAGQTAATKDLTIASTHAKSDTDAIIAYDGVALTVSEEPMETLSVGGAELALTLQDENDTDLSFTAAFTALEENDGTADTLVLTAKAGEQADGELHWRFNGGVSKLLADSGVKYLALRVGDQVTILPTENLLGGVRYAMLRAKGLSSSAFDYQLIQYIGGGCALRVTANGESLEAVADDQAALSYRAIYSGPADALAQKEGEE